MSVTLDEAAGHLHIDTPLVGEYSNLELFVDAANAWVEAKVTDTIPDSVGKLATLMLIEHWWDRSQLMQVGGTTSEDYADIEGRTYAIPNQVRELIEGFMLASVQAAAQGEFPDAVAWPDSVEYQG